MPNCDDRPLTIDDACAGAGEPGGALIAQDTLRARARLDPTADVVRPRAALHRAAVHY